MTATADLLPAVAAAAASDVEGEEIAAETVQKSWTQWWYRLPLDGILGTPASLASCDLTDTAAGAEKALRRGSYDEAMDLAASAAEAAEQLLLRMRCIERLASSLALEANEKKSVLEGARSGAVCAEDLQKLLQEARQAAYLEGRRDEQLAAARHDLRELAMARDCRRREASVASQSSRGSQPSQRSPSHREAALAMSRELSPMEQSESQYATAAREAPTLTEKSLPQASEAYRQEDDARSESIADTCSCIQTEDEFNSVQAFQVNGFSTSPPPWQWHQRARLPIASSDSSSQAATTPVSAQALKGLEDAHAAGQGVCSKGLKLFPGEAVQMAREEAIKGDMAAAFATAATFAAEDAIQRERFPRDENVGRRRACSEDESEVQINASRMAKTQRRTRAHFSRVIQGRGRRVGSSNSSSRNSSVEAQPHTVDLASKVECKRARGTRVGTDYGSGAHDLLHYYEVVEPEELDGWLMLGHGIGVDMVLVKEGPLVKRATSWRRCWYDLGSGREKNYAIYIPACSDASFVACGVIFVFGLAGEEPSEPRPDLAVAMLHKSLVKPSALAKSVDVWSDNGSGSCFDVKLKLVERMGTAWPVNASLMGMPPPAFELNEYVYNEPPRISPMPCVIRNTFLDVGGCYDMTADEREAEAKKRSQSWPRSIVDAEKRAASTILPVASRPDSVKAIFEGPRPPASEAFRAWQYPRLGEARDNSAGRQRGRRLKDFTSKLPTIQQKVQFPPTERTQEVPMPKSHEQHPPQQDQGHEPSSPLPSPSPSLISASAVDTGTESDIMPRSLASLEADLAQVSVTLPPAVSTPGQQAFLTATPSKPEWRTGLPFSNLGPIGSLASGTPQRRPAGVPGVHAPVVQVPAPGLTGTLCAPNGQAIAVCTMPAGTMPAMAAPMMAAPEPSGLLKPPTTMLHSGLQAFSTPGLRLPMTCHSATGPNIYYVDSAEDGLVGMLDKGVEAEAEEYENELEDDDPEEVVQLGSAVGQKLLAKSAGDGFRFKHGSTTVALHASAKAKGKTPRRKGPDGDIETMSMSSLEGSNRTPAYVSTPTQNIRGVGGADPMPIALWRHLGAATVGGHPGSLSAAEEVTLTGGRGTPVGGMVAGEQSAEQYGGGGASPQGGYAAGYVSPAPNPLAAPFIPSVGSNALPSVGSAGHAKGTCKPCAFVLDGCRSGTQCAFCHICKPEERQGKKRGRWNLKRRKNANELTSDMSDLQQKVLLEMCRLQDPTQYML
eukprot:TRINITY_DN20236_c0_g1_i1.p1 TRINITY_DN20236_c0_g1~~TRINITY_DN20236_c0_g1_i1.p1  ORF type:complete len:1236 (+),score=318.75 TRINITY_DN20236_c0_g1_i1:156-3863(+)